MATNKGDKCDECNKNVTKKELGIMCEVCESWFHSKCKDISEEVYRYLQGDNVSWYCDQCKRGVSKLFKALQQLMLRQQMTEENLKKMQEEADKFKSEVETLIGKRDKNQETRQDKIDKEVESIKVQIVEIKQNFVEFKNNEIEEMRNEEAKNILWTDIVKKQVENNMEMVKDDLSEVKKVISDTKKEVMEVKDKESRRNNIIIYRAIESNSDEKEVRFKHDKDFILSLLNEALGLDCEVKELVRILRLGRRVEGECRPILIEFKNHIFKNLVMENVTKLKNSDAFRNLSLMHDMTKIEREECRKLVSMAKEKEDKEGMGEWIFRVRGSPGNLYIVKLHKK